MAGTVRAAAYYRMSSDKQKDGVRDSIERQRKQVEAYARSRGYTIPKELEFADEGIPGDNDSLKKRIGYRRLCEAAEAGKFSVLLVDSQDRLSRATPIQFASTIAPLVDAGVTLETANGGEKDWHDVWQQLGVMSESAASNSYVKKMSHNVASEMLRLVHQKKWVNGKPPFGHKKATDARHENGAPAADWLAQDERTAPTVRAMFADYARGMTLGGIVAKLNRDGHPPPREGQRWRCCTVRRFLRNPVYIGTLCYGVRPKGKYSVLDKKAGLVRDRTHKDGPRSTKPRPEGEFVVVRNAID
ncbi:MAG TPA: recombinase family protein, partial [Gemmataceae bacterium]|nr:recombinase family protein [Gemmataceae bacterium]